MVGDQVFKVLTEFRFEVGGALLSTNQLQGAVDKLSNSADNALIGFQRMGLGIVAQFGLGAGGVLGTFYTAIKAADKFKTSQLALANVMGNQGDSFADRMGMARDTMEHINKLAAEFALPADDLLQMTKILGPMLKSKGLAGVNFSNAIDISRSFLKSAPTLGVDPGLAMGQMQNAIGGHASMNDTLFQRLTGDTQTMKQYSGNTKAFNALPDAQRVEVLRKALSEFSKDTEVLAANVKTLRGQMQLLGDAISGTFSILKPIGQVLLKPIVEVLMMVNARIRTEGAAMATSFARLLEPWVDSPKRMVASLMQLRQLKSDVQLAGTIVSITGAFIALHAVLNFLGVSIPIVTVALGRFVAVTEFFGGALFTLGGGVTGVMGAVNGLFMILTRILAPLMLLVLAFQVISRAVAVAKINMLERLAGFLPRIMEAGAVLSRVFSVFDEGVQWIAESISWLFDPTQFLGFIDLIAIFTSSFEFLSDVAALAVATFQGLAFAIMEFVSQIKSFMTGGGFNYKAIGNSYSAGVDQMIEKIYGKIQDGSGGIANQTTNIGKVEIKNEFKEQVEPDRIAFTLVGQLQKVAANPVQSRGRSLMGSTSN